MIRRRRKTVGPTMTRIWAYNGQDLKPLSGMLEDEAADVSRSWSVVRRSVPLAF